MIRSLRLRLAVGAIVAIAFSLMTLWALLSRLFTDYVVDRYRTEMSVLSDSIAAGVVFRNGGLALEQLPSDPRLSLPAGGRYWQFEHRGDIPIRSRSLWDTVIGASETLERHSSGLLRTSGPDGRPILIFEQKSSLGEGTEQRSFAIRTAFPQDELDEALTGFHGQLARMLIATALVLAAAALVQAVIGLAPLNRLRRRVAAVRSGESANLGDDGPTEVRPLVREINLLLEERETAIERARARASDLAHGLKTPLTVLSQLAGRMAPEDADMALRQVDIIRQRADRQLQAARLGVEQMATTELAALVGKLVHVLKPVTDPRGLIWKVTLSGDLSVQADPADLAEAIGNILDNAGKWARSTIGVNGMRQGEMVLIVIEDDGPGVAASDHAAIVTRGVHGEDDEGGSGLGLAISRDIAEAYGGGLALGRAGLGGLSVTLSFPARPDRRRRQSPA